MTSVIPESVLKIYGALEKNGFEAYFVGGSVRDLILKRKIKDWDITTNATPEQILKVFSNGFYDNQFGTVGIPVKLAGEKRIVEVTTFRTEQSYSPTHRPEKIAWGKTLEEDLSRRDFTINAIALKIGAKAVFELIDPYGGEKDLNKKIIRAVGDSNIRFKEDALRLLRAVRIATELLFKIESQTWKKVVEDAQIGRASCRERVSPSV
jgi:tRNA nucleotidyltransferase (CCA-adding enzyme)